MCADLIEIRSWHTERYNSQAINLSVDVSASRSSPWRFWEPENNNKETISYADIRISPLLLWIIEYLAFWTDSHELTFLEAPKRKWQCNRSTNAASVAWKGHCKRWAQPTEQTMAYYLNVRGLCDCVTIMRGNIWSGGEDLTAAIWIRKSGPSK